MRHEPFGLLFIVLVVTILLWGLATAVFAQDETEVPAPYAGLENPFAWDDVTAQEAGKVVFQESCAVCHVTTEARPALGGDFTATDFPQRLEARADLYFWAVSEGRLDKGMPSYKSVLSEEEQWQVLTYIWSIATDGSPTETPSVPESLDCVSCHFALVPIPGIPRPEPLIGHDKLGTGSEACWACHRSTQMTTLHLAGGETQFPLEEFPRLCAQCHEKRYKAWQDGTHGIPTWQETGLEVSADDKVKCTACHNPHQPQIALTNITKDHPPPAPSPLSPPVELVQIFGGALVFLTVTLIGVMVEKRGKEA